MNKQVVKRGIIVFLTVNLIITLFFVVIPRALATTGCFDDTNGHIFETYICWMDDHGITSGCGGGNFCPNDSVTRGQMSVFIKRVFDLAEANDNDTLASLSCSTDEIAKWNGSAWVCEPLSNYYTKSEVDKMISSLSSRITTLEEKLASVTTENSGQDIVFTGVNVHLRDGTGDTGGTVNGLGNLIVGYNEDAGSDAVRTGSHNLVLGVEHSYSSYGGFVAGYANTISGAYSSVSGGRDNTASDLYSSVSGGRNNTASGDYASVSGGNNNIASGLYSSVLGGGGASMSYGNEAWANYSVVVGGRYNVAGYESGGNRWVGEGSVVLAGYANQTLDDYASISGGSYNVASGLYSSVSGGQNNQASGTYSSVMGGRNNDASDYYSSVSGGRYNEASGNASSVSGGYNNTASGDYSTIGGGKDDLLLGDYDWRAGDLIELE